MHKNANQKISQNLNINILLFIFISLIIFSSIILSNICVPDAAPAKDEKKLKSDKVDIEYINTITNERTTRSYNVNEKFSLPDYEDLAALPFLHHFDYYEIAKKKFYAIDSISVKQYIEEFANYDSDNNKYVLEAKCFFIPDFAVIGTFIALAAFAVFLFLLYYRYYKGTIKDKFNKFYKK